jgi:ABC-type glycerol-3-phosphate transport system permease component
MSGGCSRPLNSSPSYKFGTPNTPDSLGGPADAVFNSLFLCASSVALSTVVAVVAAYVFSRLRFLGKGPLFTAVMLGQTFPWIILVTPLFILFARLGLLNNYLGMIFVYVSVSIPFSIYLLVGYLEAVPRSLDEAAILDGFRSCCRGSSRPRPMRFCCAGRNTCSRWLF